MKNASAARQLTEFVARFSPEIARLATTARAKVRKRLPRAIEMVYDNFNALVIGYSPTERPSDAIVSIVVYARCVNVCFLHGAHLPDPQGMLKGNGNQVRHIRLDAGAAILDTPATLAVMSEAIAFADAPFAGPRKLVIRSISKKHRPRR